ncbi:MAG: hypothetical protein V4539_10295 [Bacteroidota bacterium]
MFNGISWIQYIKTIAIVVFVYYLVIAWIYKKELLQWFSDRKK